nr:putative ribonuclease h protein [Quercus suber]
MGVAQLPTLDSKPKSKSKGEPMEGINISGGGALNPSTCKASFMNEGDTDRKLAEVQMNFSKAALRSIDPNLRKISMVLNESTHLNKDWVGPIPFEEEGTEVGNHVIDNEEPMGMQVEEGVISFQLPPNLLSRIKATPFLIHASGIGHISRASSLNGEFELKDAYKLASLSTDDSTVNSFVDNWVWKTNTMPKIECILWQCVHCGIPVREVLVARGLNLPASCLLYNGPSESIIHILRDCSIVQQVWNSLSPPMLPNLFFGINLSDWLRLNCKSQQPCGLGIPCGILFPVGVWNLWLRQNRVVFKNEAPNKISKSDIIAKAAEYAFLGVNENGSSLGNLGRVGGGGIIRNANGEWVGGYARAIGITTSAAVELWVLRDGLNMCIELNLLAVIIELDAKLVVDLLKKPGGSLNRNDVIVVDCKENLKKIPRTIIKHCFREANKCVDALARRGALLSQDFLSFSFPPSDVALLLSLNSVGTVYERICSNFFISAST